MESLQKQPYRRFFYAGNWLRELLSLENFFQIFNCSLGEPRGNKIRIFKKFSKSAIFCTWGFDMENSNLKKFFDFDHGRYSYKGYTLLKSFIMKIARINIRIIFSCLKMQAIDSQPRKTSR